MLFYKPHPPPPMSPEKFDELLSNMTHEPWFPKPMPEYPKLIIGPFGGCFVGSERTERWFWRIHITALALMAGMAIFGICVFAWIALRIGFAPHS